jgi:thiamine kinase-like enzyme
MTTDVATEARAVLAIACAQSALDAAGAEPIRLGENALFRLPGNVVARIARPGQQDVAAREVQVAQWLAEYRVPAVRPVQGVHQPVVVDGRAVTFWEELGAHRVGKPIEVADALQRLHRLPPPTSFALPQLDPFVRVAARIDAAAVLADADRSWLRQRLTELRRRYEQLPVGLPRCVVHGDASDTNIAVTADGTAHLLDLERCTIGPPEWDLTSMAVELGYRWITADTYNQFSQRYGHDVTTWAGYETVRDIRELRMTSWLAQQAIEHPEHRAEAKYRLECLQGKHGTRPWDWTPL